MVADTPLISVCAELSIVREAVRDWAALISVCAELSDRYPTYW